MVWHQGQQLKNGEYIIESILGCGGFGDTYKAIRKYQNGQKIVAIKTLSENIQLRNDFPQHEERFVQEAFNLLRCSHTNVIRVFNVFKANDLWCMEMEYINGKDFNFYVKKNGILPEEKALIYIQQIGEALAYVHQQGFLHRDVKPANILFCENTKKAILIDFGLAREFVQDQTKIHTIATSHGYAPIEQYKQRYKRGAYTDVYALAATLSYFLTGQSPIPSIYINEGFSLDIPQDHNPKISNRTNNAILRGMELLPENRPQNMEEWLRLLDLNINKNTNISTNAQTSIITLNSDVGIDYSHLRNLLLEKKWKEADQETYKLMLKVVKREEDEYLEDEDIKKFPCIDLETIDKLWVFYSENRFGFSIQKTIYQNIASKITNKNPIWKAFAHEVGWRINDRWIYYSEVNYSLEAKIGHLPLCCSKVGWCLGWVEIGWESLYSRVETCRF